MQGINKPTRLASFEKMIQPNLKTKILRYMIDQDVFSLNSKINNILDVYFRDLSRYLDHCIVFK